MPRNEDLDYPFMEIARAAERHAAMGHVCYQKFTCEHCGNRLMMEEPNKFFNEGSCDKCGFVSDLRKRGCNYMLVKARAHRKNQRKSQGCLLDIWNPKEDDQISKFPASSKMFLKYKYQARRYKFTDEVVIQLARLIRDFPNALLNNFQFALPKYPVCYLEFNLEVFLEELGQATSAQILGREEDSIIGYLIHDNVVNVIAKNNITKNPLACPLAYTMLNHSPPPGFIPIDYGYTGKAGYRSRDEFILSMMLASTYSNPRASMTNEISSELMLRYRPWMDTFVIKNNDRKTVTQIIFGALGELRNVIALLLWLNQPKITNIIDAPASRGFYGNRNIAYASHHIVKLKEHVSYRTIIKAFGPRRAPRRHEVEAHFRNFEKNPGCIHDWPILPDEDGHWQCRKCPQWRTHVESHERGDAAIGFVTKEYTT